ncbi:MAG TPA: HIT domain-containing protein [Fibrobacteria bacterium]|nr:HIT domain-containing protein [Fibrobacteria bacterium]HOX50470.1 HIT domain-containing protein [Fibrobacteria bacterium]
MSEPTLFQKIHQGAIPAKFIAKREDCFAIEDIDPKAPFHALVIPVKPIVSLAALGPDDAGIVAACVALAADIAREHKLDNGWRLVANVGADGGQTVSHLHFHLLGGRRLGWPPG